MTIIFHHKDLWPSAGFLVIGFNVGRAEFSTGECRNYGMRFTENYMDWFQYLRGL